MLDPDNQDNVCMAFKRYAIIMAGGSGSAFGPFPGS